MAEPPSDEILICPPFACITLLILLIHSVLSVALSAFKTTALCAAREKDIVIKNKIKNQNFSRNKIVHVP
jgi:cell division protein FtsL